MIVDGAAVAPWPPGPSAPEGPGWRYHTAQGLLELRLPGGTRQVQARGGKSGKDVTRETSYLVIGTFGSRDWVHTSFGRKIEKAVEYRTSGYGLHIVAEDHWAAALDG